MSDFLGAMAQGSAERARALGPAAADFPLPAVPLRLQGFDLIAEIKERSPSAGPLGQAGSRVARARQYVAGGAAAISVLTEPSRFGGAMSHLEEVAAAVAGSGVPVMRKDFLTDVRQVPEARAAGASGILLIAAILEGGRLEEMLDCAYGFSMFVLLECFDAEDVARCARLLEHARHAEKAAARQLLVGVNSRNLRTLEVDAGRLAQLAPALPGNVVAVAESGLGSAEDAAAVASLGYGVALVGTALMRAPDPAALVGEMLAAGRAAVQSQGSGSGT